MKISSTSIERFTCQFFCCARALARAKNFQKVNFERKNDFIKFFLTFLFDETINREIYFQNSSFLTLNITKSYLSFLLLDLAKVIHAVHLYQECVDMIHRLKKCL